MSFFLVSPSCRLAGRLAFAVSLALLAGPVAQAVAPKPVAALTRTPFPAFPKVTTFAALRQWLSHSTDLSPSRVTLLSAEAAFSFTDPPPAPRRDGTIRRVMREEVLDPDLAGALGGRSARLALEFDCPHAQTTVSDVWLYPGNSLSGGPGQLIPGGRWMSANAHLDLTDLAQAACGSRFLQAPGSETATASEALPPPASAPAPVSVSAAAPTPTGLKPAIRDAAARPSGPAAWAQIGAFANAAIAQDKWTALRRAMPSETEGLSEKTETISHGATSLQRVLVGPFAHRSQAVRFCGALQTRGMACLVR